MTRNCRKCFFPEFVVQPKWRLAGREGGKGQEVCEAIVAAGFHVGNQCLVPLGDEKK
jgi:hypothetical protein